MFFMRKAVIRISFCLMVVCFVFLGALVMDRQRLKEDLVRLHVVAASDSAEDQAVKLRVRDAVIESIQAELSNVADAEQARAYLQENLPTIEALANRVLEEAGFTDVASVTLCVEEFATRFYDTFTLPAGLYNALRITIGEGAGQNWWCVVFPSLCVPATAEGFEEAACEAGLSETLTETLTGEDGYEVRFFLLDAIGSLENFLHRE